MFKEGDKVVPNGFRANGDKHYYGTIQEMIEWEEKSKVLTVDSSDEDNSVYATDGSYSFNYHPSELRIATEKEIEALNKKKEQKFEFEFDFDNYFYVLELKNGTFFIAAHEDVIDDIYGLSSIDEEDSSFINKELINKIISIIPKR